MAQVLDDEFKCGRVVAALCFGLTVIGMAVPLRAQTLQAQAQTENVSIVVAAEHAQAVPGQSVAIVLHQTIRPEWHTYWRNPGDSGQATEIQWRLPAGAEAGPIQWPAPERIDIGTLTNYGYSGNVGLITDIRLPEDWPVGQPFPVAGDAKWLVCHDICIPEQASFSLSVPTGTSTVAADAAQTMFAAARARLPAPAPWTATLLPKVGNGEQIVLRLSMSTAAASRVVSAQLFPATWGVINHAAPQELSAEDGALTIAVRKGELPVPSVLDGVVIIAQNTGDGVVRTALSFSTADTLAVSGKPSPPMSLWLILLSALVGGALLNLMPCVFPILAMKALAFANHADAAQRERISGGIAYTLGILAMFTIMGGILLALKAGGSAIGWGFQLQSPQFVTVLIYVLFIAGLNLSGVFEFSGRFAGAGTSLAARSGVSGSFFTGALAAVVATPCTAPFMATAVGVALTQSAPVAMAAMLTLGLGLALPYLALTLFPAAARILPRPGAWMATLKQALAFPLYASAAWLVWVVAHQAGVESVLLVLLGLVVLAFGFWLLGLPVNEGRRRLWRNAGFAAVLLISIALASSVAPAPAAALPTAATQERASQPYDAATLATMRAAGKPVFVNMTAAWCITCKVNERLALSGEAFRNALEAGGYTYLKGDWTNQDPGITRLLETFGRAGVPLYVVFPAGGGEAMVLPQLLTESMVVDALKNSGLADSSNT